MGSVAVGIIFGVSVVVWAVSVSLWLFRMKWRRSREGKTGKEKVEGEVVEEEGQNDKFVVVDDAPHGAGQGSTRGKGF